MNMCSSTAMKYLSGAVKVKVTNYVKKDVWVSFIKVPSVFTGWLPYFHPDFAVFNFSIGPVFIFYFPPRWCSLFSANVEIFSLHFDFFFGSEKALWPPGVATMPGRPWTGRNHHWTIATVSKRQVPFKLNHWQLINSKIRLHQTWLSSY